MKYDTLEMRVKRIIIYPKDIQRITGKSERYGRQLIRKIKEDLAKGDHQFVTINEFSEYTGIEEDLVRQYID